MEQEVNMKIACIAIQSTESAGQAFIRALKEFTYQQKQVSSNRPKTEKTNHTESAGKMVKVKDLRKDGSQIEFVDMGKDDLKDFRKYARKYGVSYSMEKNRETEPPTYLIYFKAKDSTLINKAISSYVADKIRQEDINKANSLKEKLVKAKERTETQPKKVKNKEKVR